MHTYEQNTPKHAKSSSKSRVAKAIRDALGEPPVDTPDTKDNKQTDRQSLLQTERPSLLQQQKASAAKALSQTFRKADGRRGGGESFVYMHVCI